MALIWEKKSASKHYQVRRAGASTRLYTDGVFHSQYNPKFPLGGSIWDLLILPALFAPAHIGRILILGLGGGAALRSLQALLPHRHITAIEIDPYHLYIAKSYFGVKPNRLTKLVRGDAVAWLKNYGGEKFDFILDDLFIETDGAPNRAISANDAWCKLLLKHLSANGVLSINFDSNQILRNSAFVKQSKFSQLFASRLSLSVPGYDNRIAGLFKTSQNQSNLKRSLQELEDGSGKRLTQRLKARIRKI